MTVLDTLAPALGQWTGTMRFRMMPTDDYTDSPATATVSVVGGAYVSIAYTWSHEGTAHNGVLLIGRAMRLGGEHAVWVDSFHASPEWMTFEATTTDSGLLLTGSYPAGEGPDWGWLIRIDEGKTPATFTVAMDNIVPRYDPYQVVEMKLRRP